MKVTKVFFSPTGTTKKVVDAIGKRFDAKTVDITLPKDRHRDIIFGSDEMLIIGIPVYAGRVPSIIINQILRIKGNNTPAVLVAVYGNRHYDDALLELKDLMIAQGFLPFAAGAFIGQHSYTEKIGTGRPDVDDMKIVEVFSDEIAKKLSCPYEVDVPGNGPYRDGMAKSTFGPVVDDICLKCGICAIKCPTGAIKFNRNISVQVELCIKCHACVQSCPINAIDFGIQVNPVRKSLEERCSVRREPEMFL